MDLGQKRKLNLSLQNERSSGTKFKLEPILRVVFYHFLSSVTHVTINLHMCLIVTPHTHTHTHSWGCPAWVMVATTNYNITTFFPTQESIMDCKERSGVRIYSFLYSSVKTVENLGNVLLVISCVCPTLPLSLEATKENTQPGISRALSLGSSFLPWPQRAF